MDRADDDNEALEPHADAGKMTMPKAIHGLRRTFLLQKSIGMKLLKINMQSQVAP